MVQELWEEQDHFLHLFLLHSTLPVMQPKLSLGALRVTLYPWLILILQPTCDSFSSIFQILKLYCHAGFLFGFVLSPRVVNFILLNSVPCPTYQGWLGTLLFYPFSDSLPDFVSSEILINMLSVFSFRRSLTFLKPTRKISKVRFVEEDEVKLEWFQKYILVLDQ